MAEQEDFSGISMEIQGSERDAFYRVRVNGIVDYKNLISLWNNPGSDSAPWKKRQGNVGGMARIKSWFSFFNIGEENSFFRMLQDARPYTLDGKETYYTDVVIKIPENDYNRLSKTERNTIQRLFKQEHKKSFGASGYNNRTPSYFLTSTKSLRSGKAEFLFGESIFLANSAMEEEMCWKISWHRNPNAPWIPITWWPENRDLAGLHKGQESPLIIGPEQGPDSTTRETPVVISKNDWQGLPYACIKILVDGDTLKVWPEKRGEKLSPCHIGSGLKEGQYICEIGEGNDYVELLLTHVEAGMPSEEGAIVLNMSGGMENSSSGLVNAVESCLLLQGMFLPQVASMEAKRGRIRSWEFYLSEENQIVAGGLAEGVSSGMRVRCEDSGVSFDRWDGDAWQPDTLQDDSGGECFSLENVLLPEIDQDDTIVDTSAFFIPGKCFGKTRYPLESSEAIFTHCGRSSKDDRLGPCDIDISILFEGNVFLENGNVSQKPENNLLNFCISRQQAELQILKSGILQVQQKSNAFPIACFEESDGVLHKKWSFPPKDLGTNMVVSGQYILLGSCLFRFQGPEIPCTTETSSVADNIDMQAFEDLWNNIFREYGSTLDGGEELLAENDSLEMLERMERTTGYFQRRIKENVEGVWRWENIWIGTQNFFILYRQGRDKSWDAVSLTEMLLFSRRYIILLRQTLGKECTGELSSSLNQAEKFTADGLPAAIQLFSLENGE